MCVLALLSGDKAVRDLGPVAERLAQARGDLTQREFAERLGISHRTLQYYEQGTRPPKRLVLQRLAGLGINPDWVRTGAGEMRLREPETGIADVAKGFEPGKGFGVSQSVRLDVDKLRFALEVVEEALAATGRTADPAGKANLVAKIYETFLQEADVGRATAKVLRLFRTGT
jgi:transcriptional regulator with XRE-family HTH domain